MVLIAINTLYRRNQSKKVELLSRVFDHTERPYCRGYRMLALGWSHGISNEAHQVIIVDFHGIRYLISDIRALDTHSRCVLDRYL
jgi:hypothetical protein